MASLRISMSIGISAAFMFIGARAHAQDFVVNSADGIQLSQENFTFSTPSADQANSEYGLAAVNIGSITSATGMSSGYLNIYNPSLPSSSAWIVQNLPIDAASSLPGMATMFDLGNTPGTRVSSLNLEADYSSTPQFGYTGNGSASLYSTGSLEYNAEGGKGATRIAPPGVAPNPNSITFNPTGTLSASWQPGHTSVEQDVNQCGPASVANSLDWLRTKYGGLAPLNPNLKNTPGTAPGGVPTDPNSIVAQLDKSMNRAPGQTVNDGPFLNGKLSFLDNSDNGLQGSLAVSHWPGKDTSISGNQFVGETMSTDVSQTFKGSEIDWIISEIQKGEDVEVSWLWDGGGGHWVDAVGGGYIGGVPWISFIQDAQQGKAGGTNWYDGGLGFSFINPNNKLMPTTIAGAAGRATLDSAVSESPASLVPEPASLSLLALGLLGAVRRRHRTEA